MASEGGVIVLLSCYNGARFVADQIQSIRRQTLVDWTLLVRDDGSEDRTPQILESLAANEPRIVLLNDGWGNLGPAQSFGVLMQAALDGGAEYVAFADQDDVWQPDKLECQLGVLRARETAAGKAIPLLAHSDLTVVSEELDLVHESLRTYQGLAEARGAPLQLLLTQNFVTGCTMLINRALLRVALPLPNVVMHDWWLALCAAAMGDILYLPCATVRYRQHGRNVVGTRWWAGASAEAARHPLEWWRRTHTAFLATLVQARDLARRVERESLTNPPRPDSLATIQEYCNAFSGGTSALQRLRTVRRHGVRPRSFLGFPLFFYARVALWQGDGLGRSQMAR